MEAVTYPEQDVIEQMEKSAVPVRIPFDSPLADEFVVKWTPNLIFMDRERKRHHRIIGFLSPGELIPAVLLGVGKTFLETDDFERAAGFLKKVLDGHPLSHAAPEAVYFRGVCRYKGTHDGKPLKQAYETLQSDYPNTEWAKRAAPYRLL